MTEAGPQERLQPALVHRLADDDPGRTRPLQQRATSKEEFRASVLQDLRLLLSATRLEAAEDLKERYGTNPKMFRRPPEDLSRWPLVQKSVLNYGVPALAGRTLTETLGGMEQTIRQAIVDFEPRILPDETLKVTVLIDEDDTDHHNVIGIRIEARVWTEPLPIEIAFGADFDLESGSVTLQDLQAQRGQ